MQRQDVIDSLITQMEFITKENGFDTDIGLPKENVDGDNVKSVKDSYEYDFEDSELPLTNVFENGPSTSQKYGSQWLISCPVKISVVAIGDIVYARKILNDVLKAIGRDTTIGGYCEDVELGDFEMFHDEISKTYVAVDVDITLTYMTNEWRI